MIQICIAFISTALAFAVIDVLWISRVALPLIFSKIEHLFELHTLAAVLFYVIYIGGIVYYATYPALQAGDASSWRQVAIAGCLFGFFCYATYDLTNMATLRDWQWSMVVADVSWGVFITGSSAVLGYLVTRALI